MSAEVAQKVGRGGAGNFYTKTDIETTLHKVRYMLFDELAYHESMC